MIERDRKSSLLSLYNSKDWKVFHSQLSQVVKSVKGVSVDGGQLIVAKVSEEKGKQVR